MWNVAVCFSYILLMIDSEVDCTLEDETATKESLSKERRPGR